MQHIAAYMTAWLRAMITFALFALVGGLPGSATAAQSGQKVLRLAIGEWSPYTGANLPSYGCDAQVVTEAFALAGIQVQCSVLPWARSMLLSKSGMVDGTLEWADTPEYRKDHFFSSQPLSEQQWVFFHRKETQLDWRQLEDLRLLRIGLTIGYVYSDVFNFKKMLNRRIGLFPIEREVGNYLLKSNFSPEEQAAFAIHPKPIALFSPHLLLLGREVDNEQLCETLSGRGYRVSEAEHSEAALGMIGQIAPVDLLLTDVIMPHMNRRDLYQRLVRQHLCLKVLFMSGYTENVLADQGIRYAGVEFLQKPFFGSHLTSQGATGFGRPGIAWNGRN